jgi:hypothetical protein
MKVRENLNDIIVYDNFGIDLRKIGREIVD